MSKVKLTWMLMRLEVVKIARKLNDRSYLNVFILHNMILIVTFPLNSPTQPLDKFGEIYLA